MITVIIAAAAAATFVASPAAAPDPCRHLTVAEVNAAMSSTGATQQAMTSYVDEDTGAKVERCGYEIGEMGIMIIHAVFASAGAADRAMTMVAESSDEDDIPVRPQTGLGDRSLWGSSEDGAVWLATRGNQMITLILLGEVPNAAQYQAPLKQLATSLLGRIQ
jgi:hypothetical protein